MVINASTESYVLWIHEIKPATVVQRQFWTTSGTNQPSRQVMHGTTV